MIQASKQLALRWREIKKTPKKKENHKVLKATVLNVKIQFRDSNDVDRE